MPRKSARPRPAPVVSYARPGLRLPRRHRFVATLLLASSVLPLVVLLILKLSDVRLGQGYFAILYSPLALWRLARALAIVAVAAVGAGGVWALTLRERFARPAGLVLLALGMFSAGAWVAWAPPEPMNQHSFNMLSPSTDGAFVIESMKSITLRSYLRDFPDVTLGRSPAEMGGTRVLSNPPLTTVIAYAVHRAWYRPKENPGRFERTLMNDYNVEPAPASELAHALRVGAVLLILWALSGPAAYLLGRRFLSPAGSAVFATIVTFNPCTVHYSPGKDPAQLLTICLMLWAWFAAWQRRSIALAALGGAFLTVGSTMGLVHIWVAVVAFAATAWQAWRERSLAIVARSALGAALGALVVCAIAYVALDWNIPRTLWAVSRRWTQLQSTFDMNRGVWYAIGLPIFLLFLSPGVWTLLGLKIRRPRIGLGTRLAICTVAVMLLIYFPLGVTYELPRLWIAFLPTLVLGLAIDRPMLRGPVERHPRAAAALVLIVLVQIAFTALHWTLLDARESELRLTQRRFFD